MTVMKHIFRSLDGSLVEHVGDRWEEMRANLWSI